MKVEKAAHYLPASIWRAPAAYTIGLRDRKCICASWPKSQMLETGSYFSQKYQITVSLGHIFAGLKSARLI